MLQHFIYQCAVFDNFDLQHVLIKIKVIIIILTQTPEIGQGLGRFLSCAARKPAQTKKDLLITVDSEPPPFFMTYKYFPTVVSKLRKAIYRAPSDYTYILFRVR